MDLKKPELIFSSSKNKLSFFKQKLLGNKCKKPIFHTFRRWEKIISVLDRVVNALAAALVEIH